MQNYAHFTANICFAVTTLPKKWYKNYIEKCMLPCQLIYIGQAILTFSKKTSSKTA
jgi:hypothetical protein